MFSLVLDKLPKHPDYGRIEYSAQKSKLKEVLPIFQFMF